MPEDKTIKERMAENGTLHKYNAGHENLRRGYIRDSDKAREMQKKSAAARTRNKQMREELAKSFGISADAVKQAIAEVGTIDPHDVLQMQMAQAIAEGDGAESARLAQILLPYHRPTLQKSSVDVSSKVSDMTDEELAAALAELEAEEENLTTAEETT